MRIRVHYYAAAKELAGCKDAVFDFDPDRISQSVLRRQLAERHPLLASYLRRMRLAVNGDFVDEDRELLDGDRVDILPPVAGGGPIVLCEISNLPISLDHLWRAVTHSGAGAICLFTGVVRDNADGKAVSRLDYEAHESLAERELRAVLNEVANAHGRVRLAAVHRVGELAVGEVAVCVAASAPHRQQAFDACRDAIDRIKETVPLWKKEWGPGGEAHWVNLED